IVSIVVQLAAYFVMLPAVQHGMLGDFARQAATNPQIAQMTPDQRAKIAGYAPFFAAITPIALFFFVFLQTVIMLIFNAMGRGQGSFGKLWAAAMNVTIIYSLGQVVAAVVVVARGADSFNSGADVQHAVPSIAMLVPGADVKLAAFLATINPFTIWSVILIAVAMTYVARVPKLQAWLAAATSYLVPLLVAVAFAR
ncbi:MAG TPA: hypothetical protein VMH02_09885, partial [Verrucomicrobiae bacterium]|nr:hypothetical protein [Verrucomicrobiae bacterium]